MFDQVRDVIVDTLHCEKEDVTPQARLAEDLGADSLDAVELMMALEEALGVTMQEDAAAGMKTVGDIMTYLKANA